MITQEITLTIKDSRVYINQPVSTGLINYLSNQLSYEIPNKHIVLKRLRAKGNDWDGTVRFLNQTKYGYYTPIGFLNRIKRLIKNYYNMVEIPFIININDKRLKYEPQKPLKKLSSIELRWYQNEAIEKINKHKIGIIDIVTSGGKTLIAAEHYRRNPVPSLFVVDRKVLLNQTVSEFENYMNVKCSTITEGNIIENDNMYIATVQTILRKLKEKDRKLLTILKTISNVYIDEAHISKSKSYSMLIRNCINARVIIGLTGTPGSGIGPDMEQTKNVGDVIYRIDAQTLQAEDTIMKPEIIFIDYGSKPRYMYGDYNDIYNQAIMDETRNQAIINVAKYHHNKLILILVSRIKHGELLFSKIKEFKDEVYLIKGVTDNNTREQILDRGRKGEKLVIIGTDSIVSRGLNLKPLEVVINATGNASSVTTIQSLGRVLRKATGKTNALFYDLVDRTPYLAEHKDRRINAFESQGYTITYQNIKNLRE